MGIDETRVRGIAERLQLSEEEFQTRISMLEKMGYITVERSQNKPCIYYPHFIPRCA